MTKKENNIPEGRKLSVNLDAKSTDKNLPGFLARPKSAPVYHGFTVLEDVVIDGFTLGMITDFEDDPEDGDAFIIAPDNSRAGLVWYVGDDETLEELCPIEKSRWGVWGVAIQEPMQDKNAARRNLAAILPKLKEKWEIWKEKFGSKKQKRKR